MTGFINVLVVGLLLGGIYGLVSIGLNLIFGVIRIVNFAQGEFVMLGMYGAYLAYIMIGLDPYVSIFVVVPCLFLFGIVIQRFILQPLQNEPMMQVFATFGLMLLLQNLVLAITRGVSYTVPTPLSQVSFGFAGINIGLSRLIAVIAVTIVALGLSWFLKHTLLGKSVRAVTQDRRSARLMGINVEWTYMMTFGVGAALAGLAGTLLSPIYTMSPQIGGNFIVAAFAVVVLGGLGSVWGAFIGGFLIGLIEAMAGYYVNPELKQVAWFLVFIVVLIVRPSGLFGVAGAEEVGLRDQN